MGRPVVCYLLRNGDWITLIRAVIAEIDVSVVVKINPFAGEAQGTRGTAKTSGQGRLKVDGLCDLGHPGLVSKV